MDWVGIGLGDWGLKGCTEFVYPECWHFDNGASSKIDYVLAEDRGLLHVLPLTVHLHFLTDKLGGPLRNFLTFRVLLWDPSFMLKSCGVGGGGGGWPTGF